MKQFKNPKDLSKWMGNNIKYGFLGTDNKIHFDFNNQFEYKLQSPYQVYNNKVGVCWDQTFFEKYIFQNQFHKDCNVYFIITDNDDNTTHTFITYKENNNICYFENSYEKYRGIHIFKTEKDVIDFVVSNMKSDFKFNKYEIHDIKGNPKYGCKGSEFFSFCLSQKNISESATIIKNKVRNNIVEWCYKIKGDIYE